MANPIKAFLGKSYTKNGITKMYMYNPETERYGWYNVGSYATDLGQDLFQDYEDYEDTTFSGDSKANILRTNIKTVLESVGDRNIEGMDDLIDAIYERVNDMSDYEIKTFSEYNKKSINLYFEYKDVTDTGVDARIINMAKSLGINIYDYIESENVPERVQSILNNINDVVDFSGTFKDAMDELDIEPVELGFKSGYGRKARGQKWVG